MSESYFSETYETARQRFLDAIHRAGGRLHSYTLDPGATAPLTMDVGVVGAESGPTLVISSGLHGVEGFAGSAIQLAWLDHFVRSNENKNSMRIVLIHGINPYGFANLRRVNEENIDLNRNFLIPPEIYAGSSEGYRRLNPFLNPPSSPSKFELFKLRVLWNIVRFGLPKLKESIACGQYEFPQGLFFGGQRAGWSTQVVKQHCDEWLGSATNIVHVDIHSGLGPFGSYKLLVTDRHPDENLAWYQATYGAETVEMLAKPGGTAYQASGVFWNMDAEPLQQIASIIRWVLSLGRYDVVRILAALRAENRAHHYASPESSVYQQAKRELFECFCPTSKQLAREARRFG